MNNRITLFLAGSVIALSSMASQAAGNPTDGQAKAQVCAGCHGATGVSVAPAFPIIAGQHADYIVRALTDYQSGKRNNPVMAGFVASLSTEDMWDLAAWFESQDGLTTPKTANTR